MMIIIDGPGYHKRIDLFKLEDQDKLFGYLGKREAILFNEPFNNSIETLKQYEGKSFYNEDDGKYIWFADKVKYISESSHDGDFKETYETLQGFLNELLEGAEPYEKPSTAHSSPVPFVLLISDGECAASRGWNVNTLYTFKCNAVSLEDALDKCSSEIRKIDQFDNYDGSEPYHEYFENLDMTGGDIYLAAYIEDGEVNLEFDYEQYGSYEWNNERDASQFGIDLSDFE